MHWACFHNRSEHAAALLEIVEHPSKLRAVEDKKGRTASQVAADEGHDAVALLAAVADTVDSNTDSKKGK